MLEHTFSHISGIGLKTEKLLWRNGVHSLSDFSDPYPECLSAAKNQLIKSFKEQNKQRIDDPHYFAGLLGSREHWRLFPHYRERTAYIDIETDGLGWEECSITTIALYDGSSVLTYVNGENLEAFVDDISQFDVIVTYNGKCFDLPILESKFSMRFDQVHIDLRYLLANLGYKGGLKGCEKKLGIWRGELDGVDGYGAVLLWREFMRSGDRRALNTLLAYNIQDTVNLETLMVHAYNLNLQNTPFEASHKIPLPEPPLLPFFPNPDIVEAMKGMQLYGRRY